MAWRRIADRRGAPTRSSSKLAALRVERGLSQRELAEKAGIPPHTYWKLEAGVTENPRIGHLVNCAIALDVDLRDVIEDEWFEFWDGLA